MKLLRPRIHRLLHTLLAGGATPLLLGCALLARRKTQRRQQDAEKPRLVYGPRPIISIKYMSQAMQRLGYQADTLVYDVYHINHREDFTYRRDDFFSASFFQGAAGRLLRNVVAPYWIFVWLLWRYDIFHFFFDGGFLAETPLRFWEVQILHLAGKKVVVMPYGSDVAVPSQIHSMAFRQGLMRNYPELGRNEEKTLRQIRYFTRHADFIIGCLFHSEPLPRWDMLTSHYYPIDTDLWQPGEAAAAEGEAGRTVTIVHTPNHRGLKGSEFLIAACRELQAEGYRLDLCLLERLSNDEVRRKLRTADILAEQFIVGYGLSAMEGMALGKVVLSNLTEDHYYDLHRLHTGLDECPIVSTSVDKLKEHLRRLVANPALCRQLGEEGRAYVLKYHSYASVGRMWELIYRKLWSGEALDLTVWHPDRFAGSSTSGPTGAIG